MVQRFVADIYHPGTDRLPHQHIQFVELQNSTSSVAGIDTSRQNTFLNMCKTVTLAVTFQYFMKFI
jgi:hypothetical protein